ncbi:MULTISPECIES: ATP-binding protein [Xanthomonas]|uniref:ATP-binding protein n=1 Tax=Xanthomonas TaxID=338 RepID=UPI001ADCEC79|nr:MULTISPECIES: ATP-binding protein [unclassified Xanthomonas]MBO9873528.1 AAA family ATPase [Xanthomonas sp. D-93]WNH45310.1 AAA family ATPase [Xanthomonas sp. A6251]
MSDEIYRSRMNAFTVVVGKNGLGKSRLLAEVAKAGIASANEYEDGGEGEFPYKSPQGNPVVIAVSTSPFDRFPAPPRQGSTRRNYRYVGMRGQGMYAASSSISLLSSVTRGLLSKLLFKTNRADLLGVFHSLSFSSTFEFTLKPMFSHYSNSSHSRRTRAVESASGYYIDDRFSSIFSRLSTEERSDIEYAIDNVGNLFEKIKAFSLKVDFSSGRSSFDRRHVEPQQIRSILILMEIGLIRLMDIRAEKIGFGEFSLRMASSGEQCILVLMLGIASYIENGSLILIDEPEISLHPEWQESFMGLLGSAFSKYHSCQFIIATHSPQITARLSGKNSFVYSFGADKLIHSSEFSNKSADFQLTELFDSPGRMNEYISRVSFNLVALIRSGRAADDETREGILKLIEFKAKIDRVDPISKLIDSVTELYFQHV